MLKLRWTIILLKRYYFLYLCIFIAIIVLIVTQRYNLLVQRKRNDENERGGTTLQQQNAAASTLNNDLILSGNIFSNSELRTKLLRQKIERLSRNVKKSHAIYANSKPVVQPNYNVHIFYYAWYGNPQFDGAWKHWNHTYLPNWKTDARRVYPTGFHDAPFDIGSNYYPQLGCYSSRDPKVIDQHFKQIRNAGVGVVVVSWTPEHYKDSPSDVLRLLFKTASRYNLKISLHIEPYIGRNPVNLIQHLKKFLKQYGGHPALYTIKKPLGNVHLPVFYIYDSYLIPDQAWKELLSKKGNLSVRNTELDAIFLGLLVDLSHRSHVKKSQFDGFYTYFASNSFTYGSTWKNWQSLAKFAVQNGLIFVPSVGAGYVDTQIRPWNAANTRHRRHGQYYDVAWRSALNNNAAYVSVTSFNEWHEGTQIEPAVSKNVLGFTYLDYEPEGPNFYLNLTKWWVEQFEKSMKQ